MQKPKTLLIAIALFLGDNAITQCITCNYPGWNHHRMFVIDNTANPSALTNYPVKIDINTAAPITAAEMNADGSDIRVTGQCDFTDQLDFWFDNINTTSTSIWVNVPSIAANSTDTVYVHYGNTGATSASNGSGVFTSFDDFETPLSGWTFQGGTWAQTTYLGESALSATNLTTGVGYAAIKNTSLGMTDYVIEMKYACSVDGSMGGPIFEHDDFNNFTSYHLMTGADLTMLSRIDAGVADYSESEPFISVPAQWYQWKIVVDGTNSNIDIYLDGNLQNSITTTYSDGVGAWAYGSASHVAYYDNIFVRPHTSVEPTVSEVINTDIAAPVPDIATLTDVTAECSITPAAPTATDACVGAVTGSTTTTFPITAQGTTVVTWTYDDGNGNTSTQDQNVILTDVTAPLADATSLADATDECSVTLTAPTATDACQGAVTGTTSTIFPVSTQGTTVVTWIYDDGLGNTSTQDQNVIITDVTAPVPDAPSLADITSECEITSLTEPAATDNCSGTVTVTNDATLPISGQGTTLITWTYDDGNGNTSTQTQNVILTDVSAPVPDLATLAEINGGCSVATLTDPTATDNCSGVVTVSHDATLPIETIGTTTVTWTYDDGNGNTSTQTQDVTLSGTGVDVTTTTNNFTITANNSTATSYQWVDCNNGNAQIIGETSMTYSPTENGNYAVIITEAACTDTSDCQLIEGLSMNEINAVSVIIYPNPTTGIINVNLGNLEDVSIKMFDMSGKLIYSKQNVNSSIYQIEMNSTPGVYILEVCTLNGKKEFKVTLN